MADVKLKRPDSWTGAITEMFPWKKKPTPKVDNERSFILELQRNPSYPWLIGRMREARDSALSAQNAAAQLGNPTHVQYAAGILQAHQLWLSLLTRYNTREKE